MAALNQMPTCANPSCGKPSTFTCASCTMVTYCSNICEKSYLGKHKTECKNLLTRLFDRIGHTVQQVFQIFSEHTFDKDIVRVEELGYGVIAYDSRSVLNDPSNPLFYFPSHLFSDAGDRNAILCHGRSDEAMTCLQDIVSQMLQGVPCCEVREVQVQMRYASLAHIAPYTRTVDQNSFRSIEKAIYRISSSMTGTNWTIDPTGAANGINSGALTTQDYFNRFVKGDPQFHHFGYHKDFCRGIAGLPGFTGLKFKVVLLAQWRLKRAIKQWVQDSGISLHQLLRLPDEQFHNQQRSLYRTIRTSMVGFLESQEYRAVVLQARLDENPKSTNRRDS
ncbi:hypothetical protein K458DRAFT_404923 [Lentithecium fluviatile CBS 122367]|uniref:MYND-type domain-containing protein n=1 Tax=Lentithecium fluviatile CBS 122367 TaxID=1168545 RepID=A0A6G1IZ37_9PLEO|nr:hypothetical protein K458DRAFT_404923 [Lentithecium fluviatile CBS 122367]